jgi:adenosylcobinamide-phosphate synthase
VDGALVTNKMSRRCAEVAVGILVDLGIGDPPTPWHPVAWFGAAMTRVERRLYRDAVGPGAGYTATGIGLARLAALAVPSTAAATAVSAAGRSLIRSAHDVGRPLEAGDLASARKLLPSLVGRDPESLDADGIARAVVESVAENTVDAIVAPAWWALVGGAPGALVHRAVNTMDAMVGHRNPRYLRFGCTAARLDDVAAWIPARFTAALVAAVRPASASRIVDAVRRQAPAHPSPNAGVAEAAYAAALGLQLGGPTYYAGRLDDRPLLGVGRAARPADITRATRLCRDVALAVVSALAVTAAAAGSAR